jgi:hypothetical protein
VRLRIALAALLLAAASSQAAPARFEKLTDHYYCYQSGPDAPNVGAVMSDDGILLINPPGEPDLSPTLDALRRVSTKPVRWAVSTDFRLALSGGLARLAAQGATLIGSYGLQTLLAAPAGPPDAQNGGKPAGGAEGTTVRLSITFDRQIHLFPSGLEVRIFAVQHKGHTGGDLAVLIPAEKILQVGDFYDLGKYPAIDVPGGGSATGWVDGVKQMLESVPLLKPAIPPKPLPGARGAKPKTPVPEKEKTIEEEVIVVTGRGVLSNLMELKGLLDSAQKLRGEVSKLAAAGVVRDQFLATPALNAYRVYNDFDAFALQLFDESSHAQ